MVMPNTKQKILLAALKLFNEKGISNVRLQHIADEAFISIGNLAYHYKNKEAIVFALYDDLAQRQEALMVEYRTVPLFENIDRLIQHTFLLQQGFTFFYLDTLEIIRLYPTIGKAHQERIQSQIQQLESMFKFNAARGAFQTLPEGIFHNLAEQVWMAIDFWMAKRVIQKENINSQEDYEMFIWSLLQPYFTDMGKREFKQIRQRPYQFYFE